MKKAVSRFKHWHLKAFKESKNPILNAQRIMGVGLPPGTNASLWCSISNLYAKDKGAMHMKISVWIGFTMMGGLLMAANYEEPAYEVITSNAEYEIRYYQPYLVAEATVEGRFSAAGNRAFRKLFRYISGNNLPVPMMTSTSASSKSGNKIEMTIPVINTMSPSQNNGDETYTYQFVLPARFTLETAPKPKDASISIREMPARYLAVKRYSGSTSEGKFRQKEAQLKNQLIINGIKMDGEPVFARYNGPLTLWFKRRNEVMIPIIYSERDNAGAEAIN